MLHTTVVADATLVVAPASITCAATSDWTPGVDPKDALPSWKKYDPKRTPASPDYHLYQQHLRNEAHRREAATAANREIRLAAAEGRRPHWEAKRA